MRFRHAARARWQAGRPVLRRVARELFGASAVTTLALFFLESLARGFVSDHFNLSISLAILLASGSAFVLLKTPPA